MAKPLILVTNDDGVDSPGLKAAAVAAMRYGEVLVVSTRDPQTAMGRSYPKTPEVGIIGEYDMRLPNGTKIETYYVVGSPAQAVSYAVLELARRKPDYCVSGINFGENLGTTLTGSGTVGAALEADCYDIPGIAISLEVSDSDKPETVDWGPSAHFLGILLGDLIANGLPRDTSILNVNVPRRATVKTPIRLTVDSRQPYFVFQRPKRRMFNEPSRLPVVIEYDKRTLEPNSDIKALVIDRVVSVTPISNRMASKTVWQPRFL